MRHPFRVWGTINIITGVPGGLYSRFAAVAPIYGPNLLLYLWNADLNFADMFSGQRHPKLPRLSELLKSSAHDF